METLSLKPENCAIEGIITMRNFEIASSHAEVLDDFMGTLQDVKKDYFDGLTAKLASMCKTKSKTFNNRVVIGGRGGLLSMLIDEGTYTGIINYGVLGTGSISVSDSDTQLEVEVFRKAVASRSRSADSITIDFYYSKSDTNGTYEEFATFIDGLVGANTGLMFNRALTGGWTKSAIEAMTVSIQFNLNAI